MVDAVVVETVVEVVPGADIRSQPGFGTFEAGTVIVLVIIIF